MTQQRRQPGRPTQDAGFDARGALLLAARELFGQRGFHGTSLRQIAAQAKVNPALISYHFGDKGGLFKAMLEDALDPLYRRLAGLVGDAGEGELSLARFLDTATGFLEANRWLPPLLLRDIFSPDAPFAEYFAQRLVARNRALLEQVIVSGQQAGTIRTDVQPRTAALAVISMTLFPYLSWPVASRVFELEGDTAFRRQWIDQCVTMLSS